MTGWTSHLARRGIQAASVQYSGQPDNEVKVDIPAWGWALFLITGAIFAVVMFTTNYTCGMIIPTLAAVEDPNPDIYLQIDTDPNAPKPASSAEETLPRPRPITSKLRTTIRHLRARAGRWSVFRGLSMFLAWLAASSFLTSLLSSLFGLSFFGRSLTQIIVQTLMANMEMAWIHIVISEPSTKRWYQRIPGRSSWRKIAPVAALRSLVDQASFYLPLALGRAFKVLQPTNGSNMLWLSDELPPAKAVIGAMVVLMTSLAVALLIEQPATMVFTRIAASMLPEEDETLVPFDRTFGGKVTPEILGGGRVGILDAWNSFDWSSRIRYLKVVGKALLINIALGTIFGMILLGEARLILGDVFDKGVIALASSS
ncbi:conserved hypothetical protein [Paecilomyces variotii No. 5]|uniref:Ubiquitin conjugating enzyme n=1 Tax=Byssochlamys spectabilis (strain No. 5 / NBRC 109023) TaxID=1356009 RepID=V5FTC9_BYSSN|nr:conserved hypothetical protein [Paecilomyces variotii No. 5]